MAESIAQQQEDWHTELTKSSTALSNGDYRKAVHSAAAGLDSLMKTHVLKLLDIRATAYEKQGLLSRALDDAMRMIQYVPHSAKGYLRAGNIHMVNGKPNLARQEYSKGIETLSANDPDIDQLHCSYRVAEAREKSRFDIIGHLPHELLLQIFAHLDPERVWVCLKVSERWCKQVSQCESWLTSVTVKQTGSATDDAVCDAIPLVKNHIQNLELATSSIVLNRRYLAYLKDGIFTNLKVLHLKESFFQNVSSEDLAITLWMARSTLSVLKLVVDKSRTFSLHAILESCPNIKDLYYVTDGPISANLTTRGFSFPVQCTRLTNLELTYGEATCISIGSCLSHCSSLRRLIIFSISAEPLGDVDKFSLIKYCPRLRILGLNSTDGLPALDDLDHSPDDRGVAYLSIKIDQHFIFQQITTHIETHCHSLQHLYINFTQPEPNADSTFQINGTSRTYPKLKSLKYRSDQVVISFGTSSPETLRSSVESYLATIIQSSPNLAELSLFSGVRGAFAPIRNALEAAAKTSLQNLTLSIAYFEDTMEDRYKHLLSLLRVRHLTLQSCGFLTDKILASLAASESIQHVTLVGCALVTKNGLIEFLKQITLRRDHQLHTLELNRSLVSIDKVVNRLLVKISGFHTLRVTCRYDITCAIVDDLIDLSAGSALKRIELVNCVQPSIVRTWDDTINHATERGVALLVV